MSFRIRCSNQMYNLKPRKRWNTDTDTDFTTQEDTWDYTRNEIWHTRKSLMSCHPGRRWGGARGSVLREGVASLKRLEERGAGENSQKTSEMVSEASCILRISTVNPPLEQRLIPSLLDENPPPPPPPPPYLGPPSKTKEASRVSSRGMWSSTSAPP